MKLILVLSVFVLGPFFIHAQPTGGDSSSANCITFWSKGDYRNYSIIHDKKMAQPGQPATFIHFVYNAQVSVIEATPSDYTIKWVFHLPDTTGTEGVTNILPVFNGMQMIYRISEMGAFIELVNWEEVRDNYIKLMELSLPKVHDNAATATIDAARNLFSTREAVESALIKEIQLFHLPYGYTFSTTKMNVNTKLSNPFGKAPLPAIQSFQVTSLYPQLDRFTLVIEQHVDKDNSSPVPGNQPQPAPFEINDYSEYQFTRSNGWIRRLLYSRTAVNGGSMQSDAYTIEMTD